MDSTRTASLTGANLLAGRDSTDGTTTLYGHNPATGQRLEPAFQEATPAEVREAVEAATAAFAEDRGRSQRDRAELLEAVADRIEGLGDVLVDRVMEETGLPEGRVRGERGRTCGQLRMFAALLREGSWVDARIETALPDRAPVPRPDLRNMLVPLGPVAVFGASNFPLAFSVAGGDTASALAAGCPVVCKAHPAHPGTSELVGRAISMAVHETGFHPGTFSLVHGGGAAVGMALVKEDGIEAVGFTGSLRAGRALYDAAAARPRPIPVFAEMGSVNPVFVMPDALRDRAGTLATGLCASVTMGSGQFCTNPGLVLTVKREGLAEFTAGLEEAFSGAPAQLMLHNGIAEAYTAGASRLTATHGVSALANGGRGAGAQTQPAVFVTDAQSFEANPHLHEEVFGPCSLVVTCESVEEMTRLAAELDGNLTATIHMTDNDEAAAGPLLQALSTRVGRVIVNGFPTGVEVCHSMQHGGPYPATTAPGTTSVGTAAIKRFVRPVCLQGLPEALLPEELQSPNPLGILRLVNGEYTRKAL